jgi:hypothetical protein
MAGDEPSGGYLQAEAATPIGEEFRPPTPAKETRMRGQSTQQPVAGALQTEEAGDYLPVERLPTKASTLREMSLRNITGSEPSGGDSPAKTSTQANREAPPPVPSQPEGQSYAGQRWTARQTGPASITTETGALKDPSSALTSGLHPVSTDPIGPARVLRTARPDKGALTGESVKDEIVSAPVSVLPEQETDSSQTREMFRPGSRQTDPTPNTETVEPAPVEDDRDWEPASYQSIRGLRELGRLLTAAQFSPEPEAPASDQPTQSPPSPSAATTSPAHRTRRMHVPAEPVAHRQTYDEAIAAGNTHSGITQEPSQTGEGP